jgi:methyl-accepting chemotaxis protein
MLEWNSSLIVHHPDIDRQHLEMVVLLNLLNEAVREHRSRQLVGSLLDDLLVHTRHHFASEEQIMASLGCPGLDDHCAMHRTLDAQLVDVRAGFQNSGGAISLDLLDYLKNWFVTHITEMDAPSFMAAVQDPTR